MAIRRLWYLAALLGSWMFYMAYGEWFSWILLLTMLGLPWLSLLLSLPAILRFRAEPSCPEAVTLGSAGAVHLLGSCPLPMPPFRGRLRLQHAISGEKRPYPTGSSLPTAHCGGITVTPEKVRVLDYLGLFSFPVKNTSQKIVRIRPLPLAVDDLPPITQYAARAWKPKFGGGYAENHELRPYRPGDNLNQIHWKLTAKTGKWMLREPMEPQRGKLLVTMELSGTPEEFESALNIAYRYLRVMSLGLPLLYILYVVRSSLQGLGNASYPFASGVAELIVRVAVAWILPGLVGQEGIFFAEVLAWVGADVVLLIGWFVTLRKQK